MEVRKRAIPKVLVLVFFCFVVVVVAAVAQRYSRPFVNQRIGGSISGSSSQCVEVSDDKTLNPK